ncbi:MAG: serine O-acetyltransferase [Synergistaceae bacterium]|jgi:serine O-acetyltransferase|nr:serine O-acetyltransferase [Synergistaceae bacterium]
MEESLANINRRKETYPDIENILKELTGDRRSERNIPKPSADMPSLSELSGMMELLRSVFFPGFFGVGGLGADSTRHRLTSDLDRVFRLLSEQIKLGICFGGGEDDDGPGEICDKYRQAALGMANDFMKRIPAIRDLLDSDVLAAYEGDPAAKSKAETIFCYPSIWAMTNHRVAHELYKLSVPVIPRIISELSHARTGIDINPGAAIGEEFFIDHGTGVVIGETSVIGKRCRLYQGVTLGALSFPKDADGNPIKGLPRHPILEDRITVYAGATILGRVTIGSDSIIGGNVWITADVPPNSRVVPPRSTEPAASDKLSGDATKG